MEIKVFATDMDGTFLNSQNDYDRAFLRLLLINLLKTAKNLLR